MPAPSLHTLSMQVVKGVLVAPVTGEFVLEASNDIEVLLTIPHEHWLPIINRPIGLSEMLPNPNDRRVAYSGTLLSETYQRTEIIHRDVPIKREQAPYMQIVCDPGGWIGSG